MDGMAQSQATTTRSRGESPTKGLVTINDQLLLLDHLANLHNDSLTQTHSKSAKSKTKSFFLLYLRKARNGQIFNIYPWLCDCRSCHYSY